MTQPKEYLRSRELEGSFEQIDLDEEVAGLIDQAEEKGIGGKTLIKLPGLSVVLVVLREDRLLEEHSVEGPATVHLLEGTLELNLDDETTTVEEGNLAVLSPGVPHDARAIEDSVLLLTFNEQGV